MKKTTLYFFVICCIVVVSGCSHRPPVAWQGIYFPGCGSLKIPHEWRMFEQDALIHIVDGEERPIMIQTHFHCGTEEGEEGKTGSNAYFESVTDIKYLTSTAMSNGATYGEVLVSYEGVPSHKYFLRIGDEQVIEFVVWDGSLDEEMLLNIAESFVIE